MGHVVAPFLCHDVALQGTCAHIVVKHKCSHHISVWAEALGQQQSSVEVPEHRVKPEAVPVESCGVGTQSGVHAVYVAGQEHRRH